MPTQKHAEKLRWLIAEEDWTAVAGEWPEMTAFCGVLMYLQDQYQQSKAAVQAAVDALPCD